MSRNDTRALTCTPQCCPAQCWEERAPMSNSPLNEDPALGQAGAAKGAHLTVCQHRKH